LVFTISLLASLLKDSVWNKSVSSFVVSLGKSLMTGLHEFKLSLLFCPFK